MCISFHTTTTQGCATAPLQNCNIQIIIADVLLHPIHTIFDMHNILIRFAEHDTSVRCC
uniref:Uncharacterized protein n=1 Tax=Anguilla anguilla TaxID=7936 RepID=A0A0E9U779_ANGAN